MMALFFRVEFCFRFSAQIFGVSKLIIIISSNSNRQVIVEVVVLKEMNTLLLFSKDAFK